MRRTGLKSRTVVAGRPTDLLHSLRLHRFGPHDPSFRLAHHHLERAVHGPDGPGVIRVRTWDRCHFEVEAWGPGRDFLLERSPSLLGLDDGGHLFQPEHSRLKRISRALPGLRLPRALTLFEVFVVVVLQQRVAWRDAARSFLELIRTFAEPAEGSSLKIFPPPQVFKQIPLSRYREAGVDEKRAQTLRNGATSWRRIEEIRHMSARDGHHRLMHFPGVGTWTSQCVLGFGWGHADAVPLGDYDLPRLVGKVLADEPRADDPRMLQLLEPFRGHRWRVIRWLQESGTAPPRFGPRRGPGPGPGPGRRGRPGGGSSSAD